MSDRTSTLTAVLVDLVSGPAKRIQAEITGIGTETTKVTSVLQGIGQGIGQSIFNVVSEGLSKLSNAIPALLNQGNAYLDQLHQIQLETGMTAEQTSTLVGVMKDMGVPTDSLNMLLSKLGVNLTVNEGKFRALGIATRDSSNVQLGAYQIIENTRKAFAAHGAQLATTSAAQDLFGKGAYKLIEFFTATDAEVAKSTDNVRRWGGIVSQSAISGADKLGDTVASLAQGVTDIGVQIASAVDPYLRAFVDSFAQFVQSHLNEIVNFAVTVVNVVTGFISGLFGITNTVGASLGGIAGQTNAAGAAAGSAAGQWDAHNAAIAAAANGTDAFSNSIRSQIKAIDARSAAVQQADDKRKAIEQRQKLADSLAAARGQLADLQGNAPFVSGLSSAEQQLALEKHSQDIIDAKKNVADQERSLGSFEADQKDRADRALLGREKVRLQDSLAAHIASNKAILASGLQMTQSLNDIATTALKGAGTGLANLNVRAIEFGKTATASFQTGVDAAKGFLEILTGIESTRYVGSTLVTSRTGGVLGALGDVGGAFNTLVRQIGPVVGWLDRLGQSLNAAAGAPTTYSTGAPGYFDPIEQFMKSIGLDLFPKHAAGGWVGLNGPEVGVLGDKGPEYILPNGASAPGADAVINVHFNSTWPPTAAQGREIVDYIDRAFGIRTANTAVGR